MDKHRWAQKDIYRGISSYMIALPGFKTQYVLVGGLFVSHKRLELSLTDI
jgi:hypothetical protein